MLANYSEILRYAKKHRIMIGAFNCFNMESTQALVGAADAMNTPLIIQSYHAHVDFAGSDYLQAIADVASRNVNVKIALGLDHGRSYLQAKQCIEDRYSGVMIDLAVKDYAQNVRETSRVVALAHSRGISVEAELGEIVTADSTYEQIAAGYTDPEVARRFVKETGIDCLAVSVGTAHGNYKYAPRINFPLLEELVTTVECPVVVHGGSGVSDADIDRMVKLGVAKMNVGTEFFDAYKNAVHAAMATDALLQKCDIVEAMAAARAAVQKVAEQKMKIFTKYRV